MKPATTPSRPDKIDRAKKLTELIVAHREHNITPDVFDRYAEDFLNSAKRSKALTTDPVPPGEIGPNGYPVGYTKEVDKVEWLPDEENPGEVWPLILRRNDNAILEAEREFFDVIWYDRKLVLLQNIEEGTEANTPEIHKAMLAAMCRVEKKYGKRKLRNYYHNDFEWGMLNGKFSALRWVMGSDWDFLDTSRLNSPPCAIRYGWLRGPDNSNPSLATTALSGRVPGRELRLDFVPERS